MDIGYNIQNSVYLFIEYNKNSAESFIEFSIMELDGTSPVVLKAPNK